MPPSNFDNAKDLTQKVERDLDEEFARNLVGYLKDGPSSCRRHRQFVYGALYDKLYPGYEMIDLSTQDGLVDRVDIEVTLADGTQSVVQIGSAVSETEMLKSIVGLGKVLPKHGNARRNTGDLGDMFALGYRSTARADIYVDTKKREIAVPMAAAATAAGKYMQKHWSREYDDIRNADISKSSNLPPLKQMERKSREMLS